MVNVKCILGYYDTKLNRSVAIGEELEVDNARAKQLLIAKVVVTTPTTEKVAKPVKAPKKSRAKKEA